MPVEIMSKLAAGVSLLFLLLLSSLLGCSKSSKSYNIESTGLGGVGGASKLEALGYGQQLAAELNLVANEFTIPYPEAAYAFERGRLFFNRFGGGVALSMRGKYESILGARRGIKGYRYELTRRDSSTGAHFSVRCRRSVAGDSGPELNFEPDSNGVRCKNFARFIQSGKIEDKLVTEQLFDS